jgi:hypothetical protein
MFDDDACIRCTRKSKTFYKHTVPDLQAAMEADTDIKKNQKLKMDWAEAEKSLKAMEDEEPVTWAEDLSVNVKSRTGYRMSMKFGFMTCSEFVNKYGVEARGITGLKLIKRFSEDGTRLLEGICFRPVEGDELRFRIFETFFESTTDKDRSVLVGADRLRESEPSETFRAICNEAAADGPTVLV